MPQSLSIDQMLELRRHLAIVHQVPGRVRLRVTPSLFTRMRGIDTGSLQGALAALQGIRDIRVNPAAATVVIEYDPARLHPRTWEALVGGSEAEARRAIEGLLGSGA